MKQRSTQNKTRAVYLVLTLCLLVTPIAWSQAKDDKSKQQDRTQANQARSQAVQQARKQVDGKVLRVEQRGQNYRVKMLNRSGRVVNIDVNKAAQTPTAQPKRTNRMQSRQKQNTMQRNAARNISKNAKNKSTKKKDK